MSQQKPSLFSFGNKSDDALNMTNYVDQLFNEEPVDKIPIPLSAISTEDQKLDYKLNIHCDNASTIGGENLRAYAYPGDELQSVNLMNVYNAGNMYTAIIAGWLVIQYTEPEANTYVKLRNVNNTMESIDYITADVVALGIKNKLQTFIPVSKYQVVEITYTGVDSVRVTKLTDEAQQKVQTTQAEYDRILALMQEATYDNPALDPETGLPYVLPTVYQPTEDDYITVENGIPENLTCFFVPSGTQTNIGETISQTRDYKSLMASIGFPDPSQIEELTLPESSSTIYVDQDCYYSISIKLAENDYFQMYTEKMGVDLVYTSVQVGYRKAVLQASAGSKVTFRYRLTNTPEYFVQIYPKGHSD